LHFFRFSSQDRCAFRVMAYLLRYMVYCDKVYRLCPDERQGPAGRAMMRHHGTRTFDNITRSKADAILSGLIAHGSIVTGTNPWDVDTRNHGVRLRGTWNEASSKLTIMVTDADWYVPQKSIWENIESLMRIVQEKG
jgi:hypothetical protein